MLEWYNQLDPLVQRIVLAAAAFIALVIVLRWISGRRWRRSVARRQAELRRQYEHVRLQQEEVKRLAEQIWTTSSTNRIAGFAITRQLEAVFTEGKPSSLTAVEWCKALAAQKGANAIINLQTQQGPNGKWFASGDAVVVRNLVAKPPGDKPPPEK